MKLYFLFFHFFFTVMEFMTCVSFGHSCFHVVSTCRYDCSCVSLYVYMMLMYQCIIVVLLLYHPCTVSGLHSNLFEFTFEFIHVYCTFKKKSFCCPYTVINPVLHLSFFIKGCILYLIKLQASV